MHIIENVNGKYCYANKSKWVRGSRSSDNEAKCIGKLSDGQFMPNKYMIELLSSNPDAISAFESELLKTVSDKYGVIDTPKKQWEVETARTVFTGSQIVLGHISKRYKLLFILSKSFGKDDAAMILSLAWFLAVDGDALSNNDAFLAYHQNPYGEGVSSQDVSRLLDRMNEDGIMGFYKSWLPVASAASNNGVSEKVLYDLTSVSYMGRSICSAEYGYNRDKESLPQINLAMLCIRGTGIPLFVWIMNGSIADVKTLRTTLEYLEKLEYKPNCLMMDRAFGTRENISFMLAKGYAFLQSLKVSSQWVYDLVDMGRDEREIPISQRIIDSQFWYVSSTPCLWVRIRSADGEDVIIVKRSRKRERYVSDRLGVEVIEQHSCTVHVAFCQDIVGRQHDAFQSKLREEYERLIADENAEVLKAYKKYLVIEKERYARHRKVTFNHAAIQEHRNKYEGHVCIITNDKSIETAEQALAEYATRDMIEKDFDDMKNALDMKRMRIHSDHRMRSRIFIQLVAEILRREIKIRLSASEKLGKLTQSQIANHIKTITKTKFASKYRDVQTPLSKTQREIIEAIGAELV